jgi:hypothetical protein
LFAVDVDLDVGLLSLWGSDVDLYVLGSVVLRGFGVGVPGADLLLVGGFGVDL